MWIGMRLKTILQPIFLMTTGLQLQVYGPFHLLILPLLRSCVLPTLAPYRHLAETWGTIQNAA
jgi:hypothetical protein